MFAYCLNNPARLYDDGGFKPKSYDETVDALDVDCIFPDSCDDGAPQIDKGYNSSNYTNSSPSSANLPTIDPVYKSYTSYNFRYNLKQYTGQDGFGMQAHHTLPQYYEDVFQSAGITIHDPKYGSWVYPVEHQSWSYDYNMDWKAFLTVDSLPSVAEIESFARELAGKYGFKINF